MTDGVHLRLMVTRGPKATINQDPRNALGRPTVAIVAEYKAPSAEVAGAGLALHTVSVRCTPADMFDMRLNSHSRLNLITALLEAIAAGADEALMLDPAASSPAATPPMSSSRAAGRCSPPGETIASTASRGAM